MPNLVPNTLRLFHARIYIVALVVAGLFSSLFAAPLYQGTASLALFLVAAVPVLVVFLSLLYVAGLNWMAYLVFRDEISPKRPNWGSLLDGLEHYIYSALVAFEHVYVTAAFWVIILWYQNSSVEHLEPLAVYFGGLAGLMEWLRLRIRPLFLESANSKYDKPA